MQSKDFSPLNINIDNYSGPLEVLLDLAKTQKVNLEEISVTQLADQFIEFINNTKKINLDMNNYKMLKFKKMFKVFPSSGSCIGHMASVISISYR